MDEETLRVLREKSPSAVQSRGVARWYSYLMFVDIVAQHLKESSAEAPLKTVRVKMDSAPQMRSVRSSVFRTCQVPTHRVGPSNWPILAK